LRAVVDHHVDRPGVEEQQCLQLTGTNSSIGLIALILNNHSDHATARTVHIIFNLFFAGPVAIARRPNPIPSRTRSLNASAPMVLRLKTRESRSLPGLPRTDHLQGPFFTETKTLRASRRVFACLAINAASRSGPQATVRPLETCGLEADLPAASLSPQIFTFLLRHQGKPGRALPSSFPEATVRQGTTAWGWLSPHASIAPEPKPRHSTPPAHKPTHHIPPQQPPQGHRSRRPSRRGRSLRCQSGGDRRSLPPGSAQRWQPVRLPLGRRPQARPACSRAKAR
jgi:hypothetical protein